MRKLTSFLLLLSIALLASSLPCRAAEYLIDKEGMHASIQFRIQHLGYSWLTGRFNDFDGQFFYAGGDIEASRVQVRIDTASIDSNHAIRDKHLRDREFLYVSKYPEATFTSTRIEAIDARRFNIVGTLTLRGISREITIEAHKVGDGPDPWGGFRAGFSGTTRIALKDFGIDKYLGPASTAVDLILEVEGIRQDKRRPGKP